MQWRTRVRTAPRDLSPTGASRDATRERYRRDMTSPKDIGFFRRWVNRFRNGSASDGARRYTTASTGRPSRVTDANYPGTHPRLIIVWRPWLPKSVCAEASDNEIGEFVEVFGLDLPVSHQESPVDRRGEQVQSKFEVDVGVKFAARDRSIEKDPPACPARLPDHALDEVAQLGIAAHFRYQVGKDPRELRMRQPVRQ